MGKATVQFTPLLRVDLELHRKQIVFQLRENMRYQKLLIVAILACVFFCFCGSLSSIYADSPAQQAIAQFKKRGIYDPWKISEDELFAHIQTAYSRETDFTRREKLAERATRGVRDDRARRASYWVRGMSRGQIRELERRRPRMAA